MSKKKPDGFGVSLSIVLGFVVLVFLSLQIREGRVWQSGMSGGYIVKATFANVGGLRIGAPVKLAGVRVGYVAAIHLEPPTGYKAVVALAMDERFAKIPMDSDAAIQTASLLGGNYIAITAGGGATPLVDGSEIHASNSAFSLEQLIGLSACRHDAGRCGQ